MHVLKRKKEKWNLQAMSFISLTTQLPDIFLIELIIWSALKNDGSYLSFWCYAIWIIVYSIYILFCAWNSWKFLWYKRRSMSQSSIPVTPKPLMLSANFCITFLHTSCTVFCAQSNLLKKILGPLMYKNFSMKTRKKT
jgi:hypothetical protein